MAAITPDMKVGEIVRIWPETMRVFRSYSLNLHCGGVHTLAFAAGKHGFDLEKFLAELNASVDDAAVPRP
jgi:hybrid cluster-associated redox disulfide protein